MKILVVVCLLLFSNSAKSTVQDKMLQLSVNGGREDGMIFAEGVGTINITLSLSGPRTDNTTVQLSITGHQATAGIDFTPETLNDVEFLPTDSNQTEIILAIAIIDDSVVEPVELFQVKANVFLENDVYSGDNSTSDTLIIGIIDNGDRAAVAFFDKNSSQLSTMFRVMEQDSDHNLEVCLELILTSAGGGRPEPIERDVSVLLTTSTTGDSVASGSGSASGSGNILNMNSDFVPVKDLSFSFAPGSNSGDVACANITIIGDMIPEADVFFTVTIETINDADVVQGSNVATVVIEDDDTRSCGEPPTLENGVVQFQNPMMAAYSCEEGYELIGPSIILCQPNGKWMEVGGLCSIIFNCGRPPSLENGFFLYQTVCMANYSCNSGYTLNGSSIITCQSNGSWTELGVCSIVDCGFLEPLTNGMITFSPAVTTQLRTIATYSCESGFRIHSVLLIPQDLTLPTRVCLDTGKWSGPPYTCEGVECGTLEMIANGRVKFDATTFPSVANYSCDVGFTLLGVSQRACQVEATWSGQEPTCQAVECEVLADPDRGRVEVTGQRASSEAHYLCEDGLSLCCGNQTRVCEVTGNWSGVEPSCIQELSTSPSTKSEPETEESAVLSTTSKLAIGISVGTGGLLVAIMAVTLLCCILRFKCKRGQKYYFNNNIVDLNQRYTSTHVVIALTNLNSNTVYDDQATCTANTDFDAVIIENPHVNADPDAIGTQPTTQYSQNLLPHGTTDVVNTDNFITEHRYFHSDFNDTSSYYLGINEGSAADSNIEESFPDSNDSFEDIDDDNVSQHATSCSSTIHVMVEDPRRGVVEILQDACTIDYFADFTADPELERAAQHVSWGALEETDTSAL